MKTIQERFKEFFDKNRITPTEASRKCNIGESTFREFYRGKTNDPRSSFISKFCSCYDISLDWFLYGIGPVMKQDADNEIRAYALANVRDSAGVIVGGSNNSQVNDTSISFGGTHSKVVNDNEKIVETLQRQIDNLSSQLNKCQDTISKLTDANGALSRTNADLTSQVLRLINT